MSMNAMLQKSSGKSAHGIADARPAGHFFWYAGPRILVPDSHAEAVFLPPASDRRAFPAFYAGPHTGRLDDAVAPPSRPRDQSRAVGHYFRLFDDVDR